MLDFSIYVLYRAASARRERRSAARRCFRSANCSGSARGCFSRNTAASRGVISSDRVRRGAFRTRTRAPDAPHISNGSARTCFAPSNSAPCRSRKRRAASRSRTSISCTTNCAPAARSCWSLSHLGSWELFAQLLARELSYVRTATVYQPLGNRYIDADVRQKRARAGVELFDRREGFHGAIELLRSGGADRNPERSTRRRPGPLDAVLRAALASTTPLPGLLAKRTKAAVIGAAIYYRGPGRWRMVFTPPINQPGDFGRGDHGQSERNDRGANSHRAGRLVLGPQPLENAEAEFPPRELQARHLPPAGTVLRRA